MHKKEIFYILLDPRFSYVADMVHQHIQGNKNSDCAIVRILPYIVNRAIRSDVGKYLIIDNPLIRDQGLRNILIPEHEDFNITLSTSKKFRDILLETIENQDETILYTFTSSFINLSLRGLRIIGTNSIIATKYDSKIVQKAFFEKLGIPHPMGTIYKNFHNFRENLDTRFKPGFIYCEYGSGGARVAAIKNPDDLKKFQNNIPKRDLNNRFIYAEILEVSSSPNTCGFITDNRQVIVLSISDQILNGPKYLGNIYPAAVNKCQKEQIISYTRTIGEELARESYTGYFGCDFIIDKRGEIFIVDLNPRKQGGFLMNYLMYEHVRPKGCPSLLELEFGDVDELAPGHLSRVENPDLGFAWAQCKISPPKTPVDITGELYKRSGKLLDGPRTSLVESFFPMGYRFVDGSFMGHVCMTSQSREKIGDQIAKKEKTAIEEITNGNA